MLKIGTHALFCIKCKIIIIIYVAQFYIEPFKKDKKDAKDKPKNASAKACYQILFYMLACIQVDR
jgi:hypothetical protein